MRRRRNLYLIIATVSLCAGLVNLLTGGPVGIVVAELLLALFCALVDLRVRRW